MGQLYSKLNQLIMNDVDTAADPERYREKLETAFTTPARVISVLLDDPRSATVNIERTPIYVAVGEKDSTETPKTAKALHRPRYLETDLDAVLNRNKAPKSMVHSRILALSTSTPVQTKSIISNDSDEEQGENEDAPNNELVDAITEDISELKFSDTGICEVVTTEMTSTVPSDSGAENANIMLTKSYVSSADEAISFKGEPPIESVGLSYAEEIIIDSRDVEEISNVEVVPSEVDTSLMVNWSGIGEQERSVGVVDELSAERLLPPVNDTIESKFDDFSVDDSKLASYQLSDSMIVHNDSVSFDNHESDRSLEWDSMNDSLLVNSPAAPFTALQHSDMDVLNKKNLLSTPQKNLLSNKPLVRTPLGDVSTNSPVITTPNHQTNGKLLMVPQDGKIWKNIRDERLKMGFDAENTPPPHSVFNSMPPEVVQSAPGKLRTKNLKTATKWSNNDSLLI